MKQSSTKILAVCIGLNKVKLHGFLWQLDLLLLRTSIKCEITHFLPLTIPDILKGTIRGDNQCLEPPDVPLIFVEWAKMGEILKLVLTHSIFLGDVPAFLSTGAGRQCTW